MIPDALLQFFVELLVQVDVERVHDVRNGHLKGFYPERGTVISYVHQPVESSQPYITIRIHFQVLGKNKSNFLKLISLCTFFERGKS